MCAMATGLNAIPDSPEWEEKILHIGGLAGGEPGEARTGQRVNSGTGGSGDHMFVEAERPKAIYSCSGGVSYVWMRTKGSEVGYCAVLGRLQHSLPIPNHLCKGGSTSAPYRDQLGDDTAHPTNPKLRNAPHRLK